MISDVVQARCVHNNRFRSLRVGRSDFTTARFTVPSSIEGSGRTVLRPWSTLLLLHPEAIAGRQSPSCVRGPAWEGNCRFQLGSISVPSEVHIVSSVSDFFCSCVFWIDFLLERKKGETKIVGNEKRNQFNFRTRKEKRNQFNFRTQDVCIPV